MTQKITINQNPSKEKKTEYLESSSTLSKKTETTIRLVGKIKKRVIEENYTISNNFMAISGQSITTIKNGIEGIPSIVTNTPSVRKAINNVCLGLTWKDDYNMTSSVQGIKVLSLPVLLESTVEAIHEPITTAAGTFDTIRLRHKIRGLESFSWISTKYGVKVQGGHFKTSGEYVGEEELIFIQP